MMLLTLLLSVACHRPTPPQEGVWAIAYGHSTFPARQILQGGPEDARWPFSWQIWLIRADNRWILVDTGFREPDLAQRRGIAAFRTAAQALRADAGLSPTDIDAVILTHAHWDHIGGVADFPRADVWIQAEELAWLRSRVSAAHPERSGLRYADLLNIEAIDAQGRLHVPSGDASVTPHVKLHRSGGHTPGVQWVEVHLPGAEPIVLASDIAYQRRNLTEGPPGGSQSPDADQQAITQMLRLSNTIVPGHDPALVPADGLNPISPTAD